MREERVAVLDSVLVWARWLSRDLIPLGRCQHLVCWDSLLGLPPFSPWPEAGERKWGARRDKPKTPWNPDGDFRQYPAAPPGVGLSKGQGSPLLYSCCFGPFSHPLPI